MSDAELMVEGFASTTGQIMTDSIPLILYFIGIIFVVLFVSFIFKAFKPIKKIFK